MEKNVKIFIGIVALVVLGVGILAVTRGAGPSSQEAGRYDEFAGCLKDSGAVFYGTFWCKYCQAQKKMFGASQKLLPYEECSTADGQGQLAACLEKEIKSYPTWIFADGSRTTGVLSFEQLAEKTSCALPGAVTTDGAEPANPAGTVLEGSSEAPTAGINE